jgi:hypothetical protein
VNDRKQIFNEQASYLSTRCASRFFEQESAGNATLKPLASLKQVRIARERERGSKSAHSTSSSYSRVLFTAGESCSCYTHKFSLVARQITQTKSHRLKLCARAHTHAQQSQLQQSLRLTHRSTSLVTLAGNSWLERVISQHSAQTNIHRRVTLTRSCVPRCVCDAAGHWQWSCYTLS